jgi:mRNA interferase RelE/StbE
MTYKIVYTKSVVKDIGKLDRVAKKALKKKIDLYISDPLKYARKLIRPSIGNYRWRIGNYRIVFDVKGKTVFVLKIGHRKEIYK